ncbi:LysR family transcriptional regulator [Pseudomonas matsuisoli]|uniref:Transcriptional regulator n=1 Tax=Pseudomonas matsuisoli TaxID=1515666 RepID=A0A917PQ38_9PSED|nr:LysR family transcriptional regulator [Pseudomonas matsuisoli]GGJ86709.1 transcriptional regulator [Pseudomonas matsuisoli]
MRYDLLSLEVFMAVAELGSVTNAAKRSHLATSAVSKRVSELEERVGSPLFIRNARGMELTPAGQSLRHYGYQLTDTLKRMDEELSEYGSGTKGHIRLHAITSALAQHLTLDIGDFLNRYPQIRFDIEERTGADVVRAVSNGKADLGIIAEQTPMLGLEVAPYRSDDLVLAVASEHPLASRSSVRFSEALNYEFIGPHVDSSMHILLFEQAKKIGGVVRQRIRASSFECMCRMASINLGLCLIPRDVLRTYIKQFRLNAITLDEAWAVRRLVIVSRSFDAIAPTARAFVSHLSPHPFAR